MGNVGHLKTGRMRMFVAVVPPDRPVEHLDEFLAPRREAASFRWSPPEQWHVTLAFMDHVPDRAYDGMLDRLAAAAAKRHPVEARITGGGAFPDPAGARVLFAGLSTDAEELTRMATGARNAVSTAGVEVDGQRFRPHVTLGRMNRPMELTSWVRLLDAYEGPAWSIDELALVASHLGEGPRGRARHELVGTFSLGPAGSGPAPPAAPPRGR
ncbi:MAG: thpR [Marmoricola sp.]|nr:thpR [Marmoricola sp.]